MVYSLFFILPVLVYLPTDNGGPVATKALYDVVATSNGGLSDATRLNFANAYIRNVNQVYGGNALLYLRVSPPVGNRTLLVPGDGLSQVRRDLHWPAWKRTHWSLIQAHQPLRRLLLPGAPVFAVDH